ncbi:hypothetical protein [Mesorhizobium sp. M0520]|uniref:hypothetical protein n=1 Tax=Mesorhizobium sp. M0520 TaxID=2956957 RepID=UPI003334E9B1
MGDADESVFGGLPPPRASDVLFGGEQKDWQLNACISHWHETGHAYKVGFRKAAFELTSKVCEQPVDQDNIVYPIVYLYRHHIELVLKDVVRMALDLQRKSTTPAQEKRLGGHDLLSLWAMARPMLETVCELVGSDPLPSEDLHGVDSYMSQINAHDPRGESFRYARTRDAKRTLGPALKLINIRTFATGMEKLADYLEGIENWFAQLIDARNEAYGE